MWKLKFKRTLALIVAVVMMVGTAASCQNSSSSSSGSGSSAAGSSAGSSSDSEESGDLTESGHQKMSGYDLSGVTIDFWNFITGEDNAILTRWIDKYNEENPYGVTIHQDSIDGQVLDQKLPVALASETGPQLALCGVSLAAFADQGLYLDISDVFDYTDLEPEDFNDGILDLLKYEDGLYGLPFYIGVTYMFWNKDLYRQAGLDPEVPPKTWDELYENAKKISALDDRYYGLNFAYTLMYSIYDVMASYGGKIITMDEDTGLYKNEIVSDANKEALTAWQKFYKEGLNPVDASSDLFYAGIVGTAIDGPWVGSTARDDYGLDVGFGLAPGASAGTYYYAACMNMSVTNNAKTQEEILACYDWMAYWNQPDPVIEFAIEVGAPVHLKEAVKDPRIADNAELAAMSDFEGRSAWNWVPVGFTHGDEVNEQMISMFEALAMGGDIDTSLQKCSDYVDDILETANEERIAAGKAKAAE